MTTVTTNRDDAPPRRRARTVGRGTAGDAGAALTAPSSHGVQDSSGCDTTRPGGAAHAKPRLPSAGVAPRHVTRDRRTPRLQPRHGHAERRAGDVVQTDLIEEVDRLGIAAVLTADAAVQVVSPGAPLLHRNADELSDTLAVDRLEG